MNLNSTAGASRANLGQRRLHQRAARAAPAPEGGWGAVEHQFRALARCSDRCDLKARAQRFICPASVGADHHLDDRELLRSVGCCGSGGNVHDGLSHLAPSPSPRGQLVDCDARAWPPNRPTPQRPSRRTSSSTRLLAPKGRVPVRHEQAGHRSPLGGVVAGLGCLRPRAPR
jgi:hypothetical protein